VTAPQVEAHDGGAGAEREEDGDGAAPEAIGPAPRERIADDGEGAADDVEGGDVGRAKAVDVLEELRGEEQRRPGDDLERDHRQPEHGDAPRVGAYQRDGGGEGGRRA